MTGKGTESLEQRVAYHLGSDGGSGQRKVKARFRSIQSAVPFAGRTVLDVGCSGGYFSFHAARTASTVVGLDADEELLAGNRNRVAAAGLKNLHFQNCLITPDSVRCLPDFDVVLYLSVFHHLLAASDAYGWNAAGDEVRAWEALRLLKSKAREAFVFEIGLPTEGYEWCSRLPPMKPNPRAWVLREVFGAEFARVEVISAPVHRGLFGAARRALEPRTRGTTLMQRAVRHGLALDPRDGRDLFIGFR